MSFTIVAAVGFVGLTVAQMDAQRKAAHEQQDAVRNAQEADARATAKQQADAVTNANDLRVSQRRAYQANVLALGGQRDSTLGGGNVLARGASATQRAAAAMPTTNVLGGGAPVTTAS